MATLPQIGALQNPINIVWGERNKQIIINAESTDGGVLSYQWYVSDTNSYNGIALAGETQNVLFLPSDTIGTKYYYCLVVNSLDGDSIGCNTTIVEVNTKSVESYFSMLLTDKEYLVSILNSKGIAATVDETYDTLIPKVAQIATNQYELPIASNTTLGGIKVGENLVINGEGVLSTNFNQNQMNAINSGITQELVDKIGEPVEFTESQWNAINSGVTAELVRQIGQGGSAQDPNSHTHGNKELLDSLTNTGADNQFLAADGQYHEIVNTVDDALSDTSENPVQNKVVTTKLNQFQTDLDNIPKYVAGEGINIVAEETQHKIKRAPKTFYIDNFDCVMQANDYRIYLNYMFKEPIYAGDRVVIDTRRFRNYVTKACRITSYYEETLSATYSSYIYASIDDVSIAARLTVENLVDRADIIILKATPSETDVDGEFSYYIIESTSRTNDESAITSFYVLQGSKTSSNITGNFPIPKLKPTDRVVALKVWGGYIDEHAWILWSPEDEKSYMYDLFDKNTNYVYDIGNRVSTLQFLREDDYLHIDSDSWGDGTIHYIAIVRTGGGVV